MFYRFLILDQTNPVLYHFEIVEHNEFRRLVHLSLKTAPATDNDIKKHMSDTIGTLKVHNFYRFCCNWQEKQQRKVGWVKYFFFLFLS